MNYEKYRISAKMTHVTGDEAKSPAVTYYFTQHSIAHGHNEWHTVFSQLVEVVMRICGSFVVFGGRKIAKIIEFQMIAIIYLICHV